MIETEHNKKAAKRQSEQVAPPVRYLKSTISVRSFSDQIIKFISNNFKGAYDCSFCNVLHRELYMAIDGFSLFLKLNFVAAALSFQNIRIQTELDNHTFHFIMYYDTSCISETSKAAMNETAARSGFSTVFEPDRVIAVMPTALNFGLDVSAINRNFVYNSLMRVFFLDEEPFVLPQSDDGGNSES